ncbi:hypothetical protein [Demequina phytophila]|uniref:hypothetical protein n=1 Tax=Demequina phytophila TaxID=1638981 RepID=UPI0007860D6F|nr:hypothetical protein [Demequina phytophila]
METWQAVAIGIIPSIGVGAIFWFAMRSVIRADRNERAALAEEDARAAAEQAGTPDTRDDAPAGSSQEPRQA